MEKLKYFEDFVKENKDEIKSYFGSFEDYSKSLRDLQNTYYIKVTFFDSLLLEHESIKRFKKSNNRYYFHSEETDPPVKAHYHVIHLKGQQEIYAVNVDGTSHHRVNKGVQIPRKEADELRKLGVSINTDNIIEHISNYDNILGKLLTEGQNIFTERFLIKIEE